MKIQVEYVAQIKEAAGVSGEAVSLAAGASVLELLQAVAKAHERLGGLLLDPTGAVRPSALVFIGDEQYDAAEPRPLRDGDTVTLMSPLAGG